MKAMDFLKKHNYDLNSLGLLFLQKPIQTEEDAIKVIKLMAEKKGAYKYIVNFARKLNNKEENN